MRLPLQFRWSAGAGIAAALFLSFSVTAQQPTFQARTEMVRVDVRVSLQGRAVANLAPSDFEVLDNGVRQDVRFVAADAVRLDVVLALDVSGSVQGLPLQRLQEAAGELLADLRPDDRATILPFAESMTIGRGIEGRLGVPPELTRRPRGKLTSLRDAAFSSLLLADAPNARPLVVVFSDGFDTASWLSVEQVLETARRGTAVIYGVTTGPAPPFLDRLAEATGGRVVGAAWDETLPAVFRQVLEDFRARYFLGYVPTGVPQVGWHTLRVRTKDPRFTVEARPGYLRDSSSKSE